MFSNISKSLRPFFLLLVIPVVAIILSHVLSERYNITILRPQLKEMFVNAGILNEDVSVYDIRHICSKDTLEDMRTNRDSSAGWYEVWVEVCDEVKPMLYLADYAQLFIVAAFVLILGLLISVYLSKKSRLALLIIFKVGAMIVPLSMIGFVFGEGVLLLAVLFYGQSWFLERVFIKPLILVGLFVAYASWKLISNIISKFKAKSIVVGYAVTPKEQPHLWKFVRELSDEMKTDVPNNIILGLGCEYYVTQADITCISGNCVGKTLFLSLTLLNKLSQNELKAIIAHELAHFQGKDTLYTLHFYPSWRRLNVCLNDLYSTGSSLAIPYISLLDYFIQLFKSVETKFDREREKIADLSSARITSGKDLSFALAKLHLYAPYWDLIEEKRGELINEGKILHNEDGVFEEITKDVLEKANIMDSINNQSIPHPTDTHPTFAQRLNYLNIKQDSITKKTLVVKMTERAAKLIEKKEEVECQLSDMEYTVLYQQLEAIKTAMAEQQKYQD